MNKLKWLHLSDFHFGKLPDSTYQQPLISSKIIKHLKDQSELSGAPDLIFITGDIANSGKPEEYSQFNDHIIVPISELLGEAFLEKIYLVPGNHDVHRDTNKRFGRDEFLELSGNFEPTPSSNIERKMLLDRFENYIAHTFCFHSKHFEGDDGSYYDHLTIGTNRVSVVGLNTAWLCKDENDYGNLTPGVALLRNALSKTADSDFIFVLGHHPLNWFSKKHIDAIKAILGQHNAIYLHGHMHEAWGKPEYLNGTAFMSVQAGAAFQAPEGSKWRNSLLWGEADLQEKHIELQPFEWCFSEQCWKHSSAGFPEAHRIADRWRYDLPKTPSRMATPIKKATPPGGWEVLAYDDLAELTRELSEEVAVYYFDGAAPAWETALSSSIRRREVVTELVTTFEALVGRTKLKPTAVCTLLAAGCEGKTTALLQASYELISRDKNKKILFRKNSTRPFEVEKLVPVLAQHTDWLIVIDDADQVAKDIQSFIEAGCPDFEGRVHFLLACRDSDWKASEAIDLPWDFSASYKAVMLKDLSKVDAENIVQAWSRYGARGLGEGLCNLDEDVRVEKLRYFARQESKRSSGAFFGALLLCRHNSNLLSHAEAMLMRLDGVSVSSDKTMRQALGYIAAMHAEDFDKLSFDILAAVMHLNVPKLHKLVINRLGQEAAATSTSTAVFTRHKYIAEAIVEVLETKFDVDITDLLIELAVTAGEQAKTSRVPNLDFWRFKMADALYGKGKTRVAIALSEAVLAADQANHRLRTKLAKFYRMEGSIDDAVNLFRNDEIPSSERGYYFEWSVCEEQKRRPIESASLALYALSDDIDASQLEISDAVICLNGLTDTLSSLHRDYADDIFVKASDSAWSLIALLCRARNDLEANGLKAYQARLTRKRAKSYTGDAAIKNLFDLCARLGKYKIRISLPGQTPVSSLPFDDLKMLVQNLER